MPERTANGKELVAWLESTDADLRGHVLGNTMKDLNRWREGEQAEEHRIDLICTKLGLHLTMVPDELWNEGVERG